MNSLLWSLVTFLAVLPMPVTASNVYVPSDYPVNLSTAQGLSPRIESESGGWSALEILIPGGGGSPTIGFSPDGVSHIFWSWSSGIFHKSHNQEGWSAGEKVYSPSNDFFRLVSYVGPDGTPWFAYHQRGGGGRDVYVGHAVDAGWSTPVRVSPSNGKYNFAPKMAVGVDVVWITWYAQSFNDPASDIYAARRTDQGWSEPALITEGIPGYHWFSNIAVDNDGRGHLVWGDSNSGVIYYAANTEGSWSAPFAINPEVLGVRAGGWPASSIACDNEGNPHIAWVGQEVLAGGELGDWDIYYSGFDGEHWTTPFRINIDNTTVDAYPELRIGVEGALWVTWMDGNPAGLSEYRVRAVRSYDGESWVEWRIDDETYFYDGTPWMDLDQDGIPWVIWDADYQNFREVAGDIVVTRYDPMVPATSIVVQGVGLESSAEILWSTVGNMYSAFEIERQRDSKTDIVARIPTTDRESYVWVDQNVPAGLWTYRVLGFDRVGQREFLGSTTVRVGGPPVRLMFRYLGSKPHSIHQLRVGSPTATTLALRQLDTLGRLLIAREIEIPAGWSTLDWESRLPTGSHPSAGVYWLVGRLGNGDQAVLRLVELPQK